MGCVSWGETSEAVGWLRKMEERNSNPNEVVYSTLMHGLCKDGFVSEALGLCLEMGSKGIRPDLVTYTCLIQGLCNFRRWKEAGSLLDEMMKMRVMLFAKKGNLCRQKV